MREGLSDKEPVNRFRVPEGYFETLPDIVLARAASEAPELTVERKGIVRMINRPVWAYAAILAGVLIAVAVLIDRPEEVNVFASISDEEAYTYIYDHIGEFSSDDIMVVAGETVYSEEYNELSSEEVNMALDELLQEIDPEALDEIF